MPKPNTFKASVYVITERDGKVPVFLRHGTKWLQGFYTIAAGQAEPHETLAVSAARELKEELGIEVDVADLELVHCQYRNHGVDDVWFGAFFKAKKWRGEPKLMEPELHSDLQWVDMNSLPQPMIPYEQAAFDAMAKGLLYSDYYENKNEG